MNLQEYLLNKLVEELAEAAVEICKIQSFDLQGAKPGHEDESNLSRLYKELDDVNGAIALLRARTKINYIPDGKAVESKMLKIMHYALVSVALGRLRLTPREMEIAKADSGKWLAAQSGGE